MTLFRTILSASAAWRAAALLRGNISREGQEATLSVDLRQQKDAVEDMKLWLEEASNATLVVMGDSTMILLSKAMREMFADYEEHAGAQYFPEEAREILKSDSCPHTIEGVYTSYFGAPLNLTLHRIGLHSRLADDTGCFDQCLVDAVAELQPGAVVWNFGLHLMHVYPERSCVAEPEKQNYHNCGDYGSLVKSSAAALMKVTPLLIWRTTNAICEEKYHPDTVKLLEAWHGETTGAELEERCQEECGLGEGRSCLDELADAHGAQLQRRLSLQAITSVSRDIALLDAFTMTEDRCDMTPDGEHYAKLSYDEVSALAFILASRSA